MCVTVKTEKFIKCLNMEMLLYPLICHLVLAPGNFLNSTIETFSKSCLTVLDFQLYGFIAKPILLKVMSEFSHVYDKLLDFGEI